MHRYAPHSDDFYVNMSLCSEMDLPSSRETVLHFLESIQRRHPDMRNFYGREQGDFVLEEDKDQGRYRFVAIEQRRLCGGHVNPESLDDAMALHELVLDSAPYMLSLSGLDCEALDLMFGFDFTYRGNHNEIVAEALGIAPAFEPFARMPGARMINCEPSITLAYDDDCRTQVRVNIETRTNAYTIRTGDFPEEQLSVYVTARRYGSLEAGDDFVQAIRRLRSLCEEVCDSHVVGEILQPLAQAIASR
ncbi:MAG: hypothetical protein KDA61_02685 [Planctomycetales bacterium]|nr:hypothetical protein [Planctomycetales bacterium]